ncbi:hypothetical protein ACGF1Z_27150 [Streptomyces sp. NPDC048018]|uniref:hypothetical protein n=1 Tax=Streptomyces sp. NPDC048018 TaxID=3365499 RepID=UPI0037202DD7
MPLQTPRPCLRTTIVKLRKTIANKTEELDQLTPENQQLPERLDQPAADVIPLRT